KRRDQPLLEPLVARAGHGGGATAAPLVADADPGDRPLHLDEKAGARGRDKRQHLVEQRHALVGECPVGPTEPCAAEVGRGVRGDGAARRGRPVTYFSVSIRPFTNQRCITTITATGGRSAIIAAAIKTFHSGMWVPVRGMRSSRPITTTRIASVLVIISGQRYWFQP